MNHDDFTAHERDDRAQAELMDERERGVENALRYFRYLSNVYTLWGDNGNLGKNHLKILCRECGIPYERIVGPH